MVKFRGMSKNNFDTLVVAGLGIAIIVFFSLWYYGFINIKMPQ